ncbi:MAG: preprotein translocase subunit YajC [Actinomycetes bacterium]
MDISLLFPLLILLLFIPIFLSGRRQRRQMAEMQAMQKALEPGDVVVTTSGLRGTIVDSSYEDTIDIEIADGVVTTWIRGSIREKVALPEDDAPAEETSSTDSTEETSRDEEPAEALEKLEKNDSTNGTPRS